VAISSAPASAEPAASSAVAAPEAAVEVAAPANLSLQLEVDFSAREARLRLENSDEPLRLVFDGGAWRATPLPPTEKGDAA
jgi:hypothetical protein